MTAALAKGILLGLSAGFAPGPLLALLLAETMRHGAGAGVRVALAPLITDAPIIALSLLLLSRASRADGVLGVVTIAGGLFVLHLGWANLRAERPAAEADAGPSRSLWKGVAVNLLSPHPYLFWISVGGPIALAAHGERPLAAVAFVGSLYAALVGSKVAIALLAGRSRAFLGGSGYRWTMRALGALLCLLALQLLWEGISLLLAGGGS